MALQSKLFAGDPKLEAAAVLDSAHVMLGARGSHVAKIQQALQVCDGAKIAADGIYGSGTAAAVLAYKRKRSIINTDYQTEADNIVGKMTIEALDTELCDQDNAVTVVTDVDYCKLCKTDKHHHEERRIGSFSYRSN